MRNKLLVVFAFTALGVFSQNVAINSSGAAPVASAMLDITSTNSGLLIPRMTSVQRVAIATPATGLKVYDITTGTFWWFNGVIWVEQLGTNNGWALAGNTLAGTELLGSVNAQPVRLYSNNAERMRIAPTGEVVVGSTAPFTGDVFSSYGAYAINGYGTGAGSIGSYGTSNSGTGFGLYGSNSNASGTGAIFNGNAVAGSYLIAGSGISATGLTTGIWGRTTNASGTGGIFSGNASGATSLVGGSGVSGAGTTIGVAGFASGTANGTFGGYFTNGLATAYAYVGGRNAGTNYKINGPGVVATMVKRQDGKMVNMFCPEAPEVLFEDYGTGKLQNGSCHIVLDETFKNNVTINDKHPLKVFIQLEGECNGVYVSNKSASGFDVIELLHGNSSVVFSWHVIANRADTYDENNVLDSKFADVRFPESPLKPEIIINSSSDIKISKERKDK